jgi:hypothetical protein
MPQGVVTMSSNIFYKQPREVFDYYIDMEEYFKEYSGDYIDEVGDITVEIEPDGELSNDGVVLNNAGKNGFTAWFSGGVDGGRYKITYLINTREGRTEEEEMNIRVKET